MAYEALAHTMTFPTEPVPRTLWIPYCFLSLPEGGWGTTFRKTSENMMMISLPLGCYPIQHRWSFSTLL
jgi:hypothetical protein